MEFTGEPKEVTVWFGKEIEIERVRKIVRKLQKKGYRVNTPFYIGYEINIDIVRSYLKICVDRSDYLYLIGSEGSLLKEILSYARMKNVEIVEEVGTLVCC